MESDEDLVIQIRHGSEKAFELLYERYEKKLFSFIFLKLKNRQDAEDVFQESMLSVFKNRDIEFSARGFTPWIYKVALNLCLNRLRRKNFVLNNELTEQQIHPQESAEIQLIHQEKHANMKRAIENLPQTLSDLYLLWAQGNSYEDMANFTKLPLGTVKSRIHTAIKRLRQEVKP